MSFVQQIAQTLLLMKADVSDIKAKLKEVSGAEKEAVKATIKATEERNKSFDDLAKTLTKANVAMASFTRGVGFAIDSWKEYEKVQRLTAASSIYNLDRLRRAAQGLRTDMQLLTLAASAQNTTFQLNQQQLENAVKAMRALELQGNDTAKVQEAVGKAITTGSIKPLKEFGLVLKAEKPGVEGFNQLMAELAKLAAEVEGKQLGANEAMRKAGVEWQNAMSKLKQALGQIVVSLQPLVEALAQVASLVAKIASALPPELLMGILAAGGVYVGGKLRGRGRGRAAALAEGIPLFGFGVQLGSAVADWYSSRFQQTIAGAAAGASASVRTANYEAFAAKTIDELDDMQRRLAMAQVESLRRNLALLQRVSGVDEVLKRLSRPRGPGGPRPGTIGGLDLEERGGRALPWELDQDIAVVAGAMADPGVRYRFGRDGDLQIAGFRTVEQDPDYEGAARSLQGLADQLAAEGRADWLERTFGPVDQFDAYAEGFRLLSVAMQGAFDSWIQGSVTAGEAIRGFLAQAVSGVASQMFAEAVKHGAYAIGSLAFGDVRGAATHGKAAGLFAAGALTVGAIARQLNGAAAVPAGAPSAGAGGTPTLSNYGAAAPAVGGTVNVIVGDILADDNPRVFRYRMSRAVRAARRATADEPWGRWS